MTTLNLAEHVKKMSLNMKSLYMKEASLRMGESYTYYSFLDHFYVCDLYSFWQQIKGGKPATVANKSRTLFTFRILTRYCSICAVLSDNAPDYFSKPFEYLCVRRVSLCPKENILLIFWQKPGSWVLNFGAPMITKMQLTAKDGSCCQILKCTLNWLGN